MSHEAYNKAEHFSTATCLTLFDRIPEWRLEKLDDIANKSGMDSEIVRNAVETTSEDPEKLKRLGELLTVLAEETKYGEEAENTIVPEKIQEFIELLKN
jgi:hypothetical protein